MLYAYIPSNAYYAKNLVMRTTGSINFKKDNCSRMHMYNSYT